MKKIIFISILLLTIAGKAQVTWTTLETGEECFNDISCVNENVTYICGDVGYIMKTTDGGKTWFLLNSSGVNFYSIKFIDEQTGFVGGGRRNTTSDGTLWKTTDGGETWQDITPPDDIDKIEKIFPIDEDTLYIIHSGILLKTTDAGISWDTACPLMLTESMRNFYMVDSIGYAIVRNIGNGIKIYRTLDYAQTWQEVYRNSSLILNSNSSDLVFFHPDTVYAYLPYNLLYTTDGFATHEEISYLDWYSSVKVKRFPNNNYCMITYYLHNPTNDSFYGNVNGKGFYKDGFHALYAVDGCNDSIFYVLSYQGQVFTNRYFEPDDTNNLITIENEGFAVFPNPTTGQLRITNYELGIDDVQIYDVMGKKLPFSKAPSPLERAGGEAKINISHLSAGIYFLQIKTEKGIITKKIVKK